MARVKQLWGQDYKVCQGKQCPYPTWYYIYPKGEPLGASVRFRNGKVVTIFTLGSPDRLAHRRGPDHRRAGRPHRAALREAHVERLHRLRRDDHADERGGHLDLHDRPGRLRVRAVAAERARLQLTPDRLSVAARYATGPPAPMRRAAIFASAISDFSGSGFWNCEIVSCVIVRPPRSTITS